ncbi:uncharacterized protein ARMOST_08006 [Armillaria ostoyae]|uniref:Heterokaryon incompatibility domain-containing protein n=1 Tax=Armillaria ostoyae TaxID=47428 RepID=A0A284R7D5_ARMOS|nr:uncharacterized protein ARMOST_08006 [Armillaria ostoyae]
MSSYLPPKDISLPEVTISAFTETGQAESSVVVPLQRVYTGPLGSTQHHTRNITHSEHSLPLLPSRRLHRKQLRLWHGIWTPPPDMEDREIRREALVGNQIVNLRLPPRRVWDLCSNRVVPWWSVDYWPKAISHAWVGEKDRVDVQTPINGYEWPVPIPNDTSLDLVRIEMLNLGLEHVWLDVLCLRQVGGPGEDIRREEWKLDVPTIGAVYHQNRVVWYLSGLGRPLSLKEGDLESDRCWFRRAWTLQEVGMEREIAGDTPDGPMHTVHDGWKYETKLLARFHEQLWSMEHVLDTRLLMLENMRNRLSTNPVDKVAGLAFCLFSKTIPAYYENESVEEAWSALVNSMDAWGRG